MALSPTTIRTVKYNGKAGIDDTTTTDGAYSIIIALRADFDQVRVTFRNYISTEPAYEFLIAATEENNFTDTTKRAMPIISGVVNNDIDSGTFGWKTGKFDGGTLTKKAMSGTGASRNEELLTSDFIDITSIAAIDGDSHFYLLIRIVPDSFGATEGFTIGNGVADDDARIPDQFNLGHVQTSFFRLGETITPGTGVGETLEVNNNIVPISIEYRSSVTGLTLQYVGDSRSDNFGRTVDKINDWPTQAASIVSKPSFPIDSMATGLSGGTPQDYFDVARKYSDLRSPNSMFYSYCGPNGIDNTSTLIQIQAHFDNALSNLDNQVADKDANGYALVVNTMTPDLIDLDTAAKDDIRTTANALVIANAAAKGYTINDLDALVTDGANPANWDVRVPAITSDDLHPNEFCINEIWAPQAASILGSVVREEFMTTPYQANATRFSTGNNLDALAGASLTDGKQGTFLVWVNIDSVGPIGQVMDNSGSRVEVFVSGVGDLVIRARDSGNQKILDATITGLTAGVWEQCIFSWDLAAGTILGRLNGVSNITIGTNLDFNINYARNNYTAGIETGGGNQIIGCLADMGLATDFTDTDNPLVLATLYDIVNDVPEDPTLSGINWRILMDQPAATVEENPNGSLGNFTRNETTGLVACATAPPSLAVGGFSLTGPLTFDLTSPLTFDLTG